MSSIINLFQQSFCLTVFQMETLIESYIPSEDTALQKDCWNKFIMELICQVLHNIIDIFALYVSFFFYIFIYIYIFWYIKKRLLSTLFEYVNTIYSIWIVPLKSIKKLNLYYFIWIYIYILVCVYIYIYIYIYIYMHVRICVYIHEFSLVLWHINPCWLF